MQWFTREWRDGALSDEEWQQRLDDYELHTAALRPDLPLDQAWLLDQDLHDGQVQSWRESDGQFSWVLLTGDLERGYRLTSLHYLDAHLIGADTEDLDELLLGSRSELLYDEVSQGGDCLASTTVAFAVVPLGDPLPSQQHGHAVIHQFLVILRQGRIFA